DEEARESQANIGVAAASARRLGVEADRPPVRLALWPAKDGDGAVVDVFERDDTSGPQGTNEPRDHSARVGHVGEEEAGVNEIEFSFEVGGAQVEGDVLDVVDSRPRRVLTCHPERDFVEVVVDGTAAGPDAFGELESDVAASAADVEAAHPCA